MKKTGLEIVEMIARGEAPKKIKGDYGFIYEFDKEINDYRFMEGGKSEINLLINLNDEFEIIEEEKVWKPKKGGEYYTIEANGIECYTFERDGFDINYYETGNCFRTEEEANKALEKIKIYTKLKRYAEEHNEEKIDWNNLKQCKYNIYYAFDYKEFKIVSTYFYRDIGQIYFTSKELCEQAIQEIGEDNIKKLFEE